MCVSLWCQVTTCLFCLYGSIHLKHLKIMISWPCICDWQFPIAFRAVHASSLHHSILGSTVSTLYTRVCDMTCHCLYLLDLFPSLVGLEFHPCCDSVMRLWPMRPSNLPFCKYIIFLHSRRSGPLDGLHIFIRVNIAEHGIVNVFQHFITFAHIFSNEFTE